MNIIWDKDATSGENNICGSALWIGIHAYLPPDVLANFQNDVVMEIEKHSDIIEHVRFVAKWGLKDILVGESFLYSFAK